MTLRSLHLFAVRYRILIITAAVLLYLGVGYYPFQVQMPVDITPNGASFGQDGHLQLSRPGIALGAASSEWLDAAMATSTLTVTLEVRPASVDTQGASRIMAVSKHNRLRNFSLGQRGSDLILHLRTPATDLYGAPPYRLRGALASPGWHRIEVDIVPRLLEVRVDGTKRLSAPLPAEPLAGWARDYRLSLGNELSHDQPWLGDIRLARIAAGARQVDYSRAAALKIPRYLVVTQAHIIANPFTWQTLQLDRDFITNLLGFIPLGALFVCLLGSRRPVLTAAAACAALALSIELGQLFFTGRVTETTDLLLNSLGGALGAWLAAHTAACRHRATG